MRFRLSPALLEALRQRRDEHGPSSVEREHDAFMMDPGLGPACYLTADGRVLVDGSGWDDTPIYEAAGAEACQVIVVGAEKTGIAALLEVLPPKQGPKCIPCVGTGWIHDHRIVCPACHGLGWIGLFLPTARD